MTHMMLLYLPLHQLRYRLFAGNASESTDAGITDLLQVELLKSKISPISCQDLLSFRRNKLKTCFDVSADEP